MDDDSLFETISQYAEPTHVEIKRKRDGRSLGYAIAQFASPEDASAVIESLHGQNLEGREVNCREDRGERARAPRQQRQPRQPRARREPRVIAEGAPSTSVFVGNLSWDMDDASLADELADYAFVEAQVQQRPDGKSRGYALVQFETVEEAQRAIEDLNGADFMGRNAVLKFDAKP